MTTIERLEQFVEAEIRERYPEIEKLRFLEMRNPAGHMDYKIQVLKPASYGITYYCERDRVLKDGYCRKIELDVWGD